ncbi:hypothetical protein HNV11_06735 [Spirosoma taeanense]|uniref:Nucleoside 2-deoxyribosyltransferase n=1 Tax=Spirosoma taeanense TaxID=2735870 RepID=A0A6M5Y6S0_9BACT|nr:hypothetical protein [Spirosoma taeanense]QJW89106.1 hypothetical protein HNV11_06735 [Spirosoma taeanense]
MAKATAKVVEEQSKINSEIVKPKCFVIMPFGGWFDKYYLEIYIPAIEAAGFDAKRADDLYRPGNIVNDIWAYTKEATVLLADLTNKNPNVFYELGLAHAITKPAILITASMEDVPFDLRSLRVIEYDKNSPKWGEVLQGRITKSLTETLKNPKDAIPPTFFEVDNTEKIKITPENKELLEIRNELDLLKREVRSSDLRRRRKIGEEIHPDEAELLIRSYLKKGLDEAVIAEKLEPLGPPREWVYRQIEKIIKETPKDGE